MRSVRAGHVQLCLTRHEGTLGCVSDVCPHQGGPLGEGSIEDGWLRCPWHGWDFHPTTGVSPGGHDDGIDTHPVDIREDGVHVGIEVEAPHERSVADLMIETLRNWGVETVFGMVGHSNLGLGEAMRGRSRRPAAVPQCAA